MECKMMRRQQTVGPTPLIWKSDKVMQLLQEIEDDARGIYAKPKFLQKNHMRENLKRIRDIQTRVQQKITEKETPQPLRVPNKCSEVHSKVTYINKKSPNELTSSEQYPDRAVARSSCMSSKSDGRFGNLKPSQSLPQLNDNRLKFDVELKERDKEKTQPQRRLGQIPHYLTQRKKQWELEKEEQLKRVEEDTVPSGYTLLSDEERVETLELLKKNQEELLRTLATLPVRNDTMRLRNYKEELERQLAKVEEGIKIFSRQRVLIKDDS